MSTEQAVDKLRCLPVEILDSARLDHHRQLRTGLPEAVFGENKTVDQLIEIMAAMLKSQSVALATRVDPEKAEQVCELYAGFTWTTSMPYCSWRSFSFSSMMRRPALVTSRFMRRERFGFRK